jgi:hypothetical protein
MEALPDIIGRCFKLIKSNLYLYLIPIPYLVIFGGIVVIFIYLGSVITFATSFFSLVSAESMSEALSSAVNGFLTFTVISILLTISFITGYLGGLGHMLKNTLSTGKAHFSDFTTGIFRYGPRLFIGCTIFSIMMLLLYWWGFNRLLSNYAIYDFATMDSGWNSQLRSSLAQARSGIFFHVKLIQLIIACVLGFWWIICIAETRHFLISFYKSVLFTFRNPKKAILSLAGVWLAFILFTMFVSWISGIFRLSDGFGTLIAAYLFMPVLIVFLLQIYDPRYVRASEPALKAASSSHDADFDIILQPLKNESDDILIEFDNIDEPDARI